MNKDIVDEYLKHSLFGNPQLNPDEQNIYLGTFRERVILALTNEQVNGDNHYTEVKKALMTQEDTKLLLNDGIPYTHLRGYIKLAISLDRNFTIVHSSNSEHAFGLVVSASAPVDVPEILCKEDEDEHI